MSQALDGGAADGNCVGMITPDWTTPANVRALLTTRVGGCSLPPYDRFNLGAHVGDMPAVVARNRAVLRGHLPAEPLWLSQVHGVGVADADELEAVATDKPAAVAVADAIVACVPGRVCVVMTADCLPVLLCDDDGTVVGAAHAGWRGLADGVLEATIARMGVAPGKLRAWLGPAIGPDHFEVGDEVRAAFVRIDPLAAAAFRPVACEGAATDGAVTASKWWADLFILARQRLLRAGVTHVEGGGVCTYTDDRRFYSYRRDGRTGRFASMVWLEPGFTPSMGCAAGEGDDGNGRRY